MPITPQNNKGSYPSTPKRRQQLLVGFRRKFGECMLEWNETNTRLYEIIKSISHLRDRIQASSSYSSRLKTEEQEQQQQQSQGTSLSWKDYGFRGSERRGSTAAVGFLTMTDVQDALSYDLLQHEKMLSLTRITLSSLSTLLDTTGRRLDEWIEYDLHLQQEQLDDDDTVDNYANLNISNAINIYKCISQDLYLKQILVEQVLHSSCSNSLLEKSDDAINNLDFLDRDVNNTLSNNNINDGGIRNADSQNPRQIAKTCVKQWNKLQEGKYKQEFKLLNDFVSFLG